METSDMETTSVCLYEMYSLEGGLQSLFLSSYNYTNLGNSQSF